MKRQKLTWILLFICANLFCAGLVHAIQVKSVRMWSSEHNTRVVFDVSKHVEHTVLILRNPDRIVVDLKQTTLSAPLKPLDLSTSRIKRIRTAVRNKTDLRVVFDLKVPVNPKSFVLNPTQTYGHRLVIDLERNKQHQKQHPKAVQTAKQYTGSKTRPVIVAIDAGHGGEDPGAIGQRGTQEKDVVLQISQKLRKMINRQKGMNAVMIRNGDYYVSLRGRMQKAREVKADLFVSIHADAVRNGRARGASVYVLSQKGASSEAARWLAASQNDADLIGGVSLDDKDDLLASVLLDLSQNATMAASTSVANKVLSEVKNVGKVHKRSVEQARFVVLKSPDIPSILVETGFISNRKEEASLKNNRFQTRIANAVLKGVHDYFRQNPPPGTVLALANQKLEKSKKYRIRRGDTLAAIAQRFQVSLLSLKSVNRLRTDLLRVGQILKIPAS